MAKNNAEKNIAEQLKDVPAQDILALASKLYDLAKFHVATSGAATSDEIAILNNARKQLKLMRTE